MEKLYISINIVKDIHTSLPTPLEPEGPVFSEQPVSGLVGDRFGEWAGQYNLRILGWAQGPGLPVLSSWPFLFSSLPVASSNMPFPLRW